MAGRSAARDSDTSARLAVIEDKLDTILTELGHIRKFIPAGMVEHSERIEFLERNIRTLQWVGSVLAVALVGSFIGHIFGG